MVASWEFWSVANMLISTHGADAESVAQSRLKEAQSTGSSGDVVTWKAIIKKIDEIRLSQSR